MTLITLAVLTTCFSIKIVGSANILAVFPMPSASHAILGSDLLKGLAARGHQVTMMSPFPLASPPHNYKDVVIDYDNLRKVYEKHMITTSGIDTKVAHILKAVGKITEAVLEDQNVQTFINSRQTFDAIIYLQTSMEALMGMSHNFNASSINFSTIGTTLSSSYTYNHPLPCTYMPNLFSEHGDRMTFLQRLQNCWFDLNGYFYLKYINDPFQQGVLDAKFPTAPPLKELRKKAILSLSNSHVAVDSMRPIFQNMIDIGGFNMQTAEVLSKDVQQFLDNSRNGVILLSFGSNVKSHHMGKTIINHFLECFRSTPYDIIWKLDVDLPEKTSNVLIQNWVSQKAILKHPNMKLFITHGGRASFNEAIYYGVPMIAIPFFLDQQVNSERCVNMGIGIKISPYELTSQLLHQTMEEICNDPKYRSNIKQRSILFQKQEMDPMEKAIYWIEHVVKNKNSTVLQSHIFDMPGYQLIGLDLIAVISLLLAIIFVLMYYIWKFLFMVCQYLSFRPRRAKQKSL